MAKNSANSLRQYALKLLARREYSRFELATKLATRSEDKAAIEALLDELAAERLQNDERYVECYVCTRSGRGYGPLRIALELRLRGLAEELIATQLETVNWQDSITGVWRKRFKNKIPSDMMLRGQQMHFLQYRGFSHEQIQQLFAGFRKA